ncbi:MAG: PEP-CTERM sorting domain-containing protein [Alphaproteobacteria bacterium]|nr:PEP-CTERM sorting domain-containing protein [Alphaproteobacteria bacterium]
MKFDRLGVILGGVAGLLVPDAAWAGAVIVPIPEPATLAVLAAGVGALALVKFRGRK